MGGVRRIERAKEKAKRAHKMGEKWYRFRKQRCALILGFDIFCCQQ